MSLRPLNITLQRLHKGKVRFGLWDAHTGLWWNGKGFKDRDAIVTYGRFDLAMTERRAAGTGEIKKVITDKPIKTKRK